MNTVQAHPDPDLPTRVGTAPFLLPYLVYVVHSLEELPGFADWVTRHFGEQGTTEFAAVHIPLIMLVLLCSWRATKARRHGAWVVLTSAFAWQFAVNACFHLTTMIIFGEYSPGVVTGATVSVPAAVAYFVWARRTGRITGREAVLSLLVGTVVAALAIGTLFL